MQGQSKWAAPQLVRLSRSGGSQAAAGPQQATELGHIKSFITNYGSNYNYSDGPLPMEGGGIIAGPSS